jgi:hypothetical protein
MSKAKDLTNLAALAQLMLDHRLGVLKGTSERLEQSRMQLSAINQATQPSDLDPIMSSKVGLDYERWADARRGELNLVIARQTAAWREARSEAQTAFWRVQALHELADKSVKGQP